MLVVVNSEVFRMTFINRLKLRHFEAARRRDHELLGHGKEYLPILDWLLECASNQAVLEKAWVVKLI